MPFHCWRLFLRVHSLAHSLARFLAPSLTSPSRALKFRSPSLRWGHGTPPESRDPQGRIGIGTCPLRRAQAPEGFPVGCVKPQGSSWHSLGILQVPDAVPSASDVRSCLFLSTIPGARAWAKEGTGM